MDALSSSIVTVRPPDVTVPVARARIEDVWLSLQYPLSVQELQRLSDFQAFLNARLWLHDQGLPCSKLAAKRLVFARHLVRSKRLNDGDAEAEP